VAEPILIWGAGAIGGTMGAHWARAGHDVLLVDTVAEHVEACRTGGLTIFGPVAEFTQVVPAVTPGELRGTYSRIVLAVKAQATRDALPMIAPHLAEDGFILSAQNGLNEIEIAVAVGAERTMGCFVNFGADWHGPGRILYGNRGALVIGELDGSARDRTRAMHALCRDFEPDAILSDDVMAHLWGKMAYGAMLFATALNHDSMTENFRDPARMPAWLALGNEVVETALARGVTPRGFGEFDPMAFTAGRRLTDGVKVVHWLRDYTAVGAKTHSGIWRARSSTSSPASPPSTASRRRR
jgi:2-dehydropantoate 2-reductase